jgi:hypothetical protein
MSKEHWRDENWEGKTKNSEKHLLQCNFLHHTSYINHPGNEPRPLESETGN